VGYCASAYCVVIARQAIIDVNVFIFEAIYMENQLILDDN